MSYGHWKINNLYNKYYSKYINMETKPTLEQLKEQLSAIAEQIKKYESGERFETGRWYKAKKQSMCNYQSEGKHYGFTTDGQWIEDNKWFENNNGFKPDVLCTPSEVEAALIAEAKKRGFKEGVRFTPVVPNVNKDKVGVCSKAITWYDKPEYGYEQGLASGKNWIFYQGQWATIIPQEEKIEIGGYEVKFTNGLTYIDGNRFTKDFWLSAANVSNHNKAKIMVGCSKQFDVSLTTINQILSKL